MISVLFSLLLTLRGWARSHAALQLEVLALRHQLQVLHEYVVENSENAEMIFALARHIFGHGIDGRFYSQIRKYHHEGGKVYWSMDDTPEETGLIKQLRRGPDLRGAAWTQGEGRRSSEIVRASPATFPAVDRKMPRTHFAHVWRLRLLEESDGRP